MQLFLAPVAGQKLPPPMKLFLTNLLFPDKVNQLSFTDFNLLQSFAFMDSKFAYERIKNNHKYRDFILDSGAFSYMNGKNGNKINWDEYVEHYAKVINDFDIKKFIELDIDAIVGLKEVERLRKKLEILTNKQSIPVWHKNRGQKYWIKMIHEYSYCAIGGIAIGNIKRTEYGIFHKLLKEAHENNCKVHGLGFTNLKLLTQFNFDSVDSSSCNSVRFGQLSVFTGTTIRNIKAPPGKKINYQRGVSQSFDAWVQYANYLEGL